MIGNDWNFRSFLKVFEWPEGLLSRYVQDLFGREHSTTLLLNRQLKNIWYRINVFFKTHQLHRQLPCFREFLYSIDYKFESEDWCLLILKKYYIFDFLNISPTHFSDMFLKFSNIEISFRQHSPEVLSEVDLHFPILWVRSELVWNSRHLSKIIITIVSYRGN